MYKRQVGFLADLKIDIRERQEAISHLNKFREVEEDGSLEDFDWARGDTKKEITAFVEFISEESEDGRRKMLKHWDHYAIACDSKFKWQAVQQWKRPKTFEHKPDDVFPVHKLKELTLEEKDDKLKKTERDAKQKQFNASSGGKAKGYGRKYSSSGQS